MQARRLTAGGVAIQIEDHGASGTPVLLLHFSGANLRMWDPIIPHLQPARRCVAVDLRAHGRSDAPPSGYHANDFADDVAGVIDALEIGRAHVIGCSLGAEVGLALAARDPGKVASLVCDGALASEYGAYGTRDAPSLAEDAEVQERLRAMEERPEKVYESSESLVEVTRALYEGSQYWNDALERMTAYGVVETGDGAFVSAWRKRARDAYMRGYFELRVEDYYSRVSCPVLMLPDEETKADEQAFEIVTRLSELPGDCEVVVVPGSDHPFGWMLIPDAMADTVVRFFRRVEGR